MLVFDLTTIVHKARRSWNVYMADAIAGRTQAVIYDRLPPDVSALERLQLVAQRAGDFGIEFQDDGLTISSADAVLPVPPRAAFAADVLSPTMMNLTAASLAHAKVEGVARAARRHQRALDHAAAYAPMMAFAEEAIEALGRGSPPPALP